MMVSPMIEIAVHVKHLVQSTKVTVIGAINAKETFSVVKTTVLQIFQKELTAVKTLVMVESMEKTAVQVNFLVQSIKVAVIVALNAKETLSVVNTIVLTQLSHGLLTVVSHLMLQVRKFEKCKF